jgi:hypothetical protein
MPRSQPYGYDRRVAARLSLVVAVLLCACGGAAPKPARPPSAAKAKVALLRAPKRPGEVIVRGDLSPASHGPFAFNGRYLVRFEQFAPEDPEADFTGQTAFVASLDRRPESDGHGSIRLFKAARGTGRRTLSIHGRLYVDVSFGDFPYAIRFTPQR